MTEVVRYVPNPYISREEFTKALADHREQVLAEAQAMIDNAISRMARAPLPFKLFGLNATSEYAQRVAAHLNISVTPHTERIFPDGECFLKSGNDEVESNVGNVRGHQVFVVQSLYEDDKESISDKLVKLLFFCGSLRDASAAEVVVVIPHLGWARQDRKVSSREPVTTKYVAKLLQQMGIARAVLVDVHNPSAENNAFDVPIDILETKKLFARECAKRLVAAGVPDKVRKVRILTPDANGVGRCSGMIPAFMNELTQEIHRHGGDASLVDMDVAIFDKRRVKNEAIGSRIVGDVKDALTIGLDDMISTGGSYKKAVATAKKEGANMLLVCAPHGLFCGDANAIFEEMDTDIMVADTVRPFRLNDANQRRLHIVDTSQLMAETIRRIHSGVGSISELLDV